MEFFIGWIAGIGTTFVVGGGILALILWKEWRDSERKERKNDYFNDF